LRLLLDAHVSGRVIGRELREAGHDVLALDEHRELEGLDDPVVLDHAAQEGRVLVTFNIRDFPDILREWAGEGRSHAGCIMAVGVAQDEFGAVLRLLTKELAARPDQSGWQSQALFLARSS
jgi:nucleoside-diphosphate-sugar epimerase